MNPLKSLKKSWLKYAIVGACLAAPMALTCADEAWAQTIEFQAEASEIYAGMPFQLSIIVKDCEESPQPEIAPFEIENAQVSLIGVMPRISSMMTIMNGKRTTKREVTYVYSYSVLPEVVGHYVLPQIKVTQNGNEIVSKQRVSFDAADVAATRDMRIELELPDRALWVGESFDAYVNWYVRKDYSTRDFSIPLLSLGDYFDIADADPTVNPNLRNVIPVVAGGRQFLFPYTRDKATVGGVDYTRFRMRIGVTPKKTGEVHVPAVSVRAKLEAGMTRDGWGFPVQNYQLYKAVDADKTLIVKELPRDQRPESFSNALGTQFDIAVQADRTIVKAGDPITLTIDIASPTGMDGLILPNLSKAGLNEALFGVSDDSPLPETIDAGNGRVIQRFQIPVRVRSERVREIPPIAFSYFDLKHETYVTVRSQPIALTVTSAEKVSAEDVVMNAATAGAMASSGSKKQDGDNPKGVTSLSLAANSGLELGLETKPSDLAASHGALRRHVMEGAMYAIPFLCWIGLCLFRRYRKRSASDKPQRDAAVALRAALDNAEKLDAKTAAAQIANALTAFCVETETDKKTFMATLEKMDAEAYRPGAGTKPIDASIVKELRQNVKNNIHPKYAKRLSGLLGICLAVALNLFTPEWGWTQDGANGVQNDAVEAVEPQVQLQKAQAAYHEAMNKKVRSEQVAGFTYAATVFKSLAAIYPDQAELYMDWGNAAFNASDLGSASLAWRRALLLDPTLKKAKNNLSYIDSLQDLGQKKENAALSSFFFLNDEVTPAERLLWASIFFFVAMMLCIPWKESHKRVFRIMAVLPFLIWLWLLTSVMMENAHTQDAVVMHEVTLRNADNAGASSVLASMIEPGMCVEVLETRGDWAFVSLPNGVHGWVPVASIERVVPLKDG